jgi:hypothetical protein
MHITELKMKIQDLATLGSPIALSFVERSKAERVSTHSPAWIHQSHKAKTKNYREYFSIKAGPLDNVV